ncbi:PP2C family protein-serine/threonine phosphatase [Herbidospora mongoliensis]|uniref:PP2C family protein-serine/threonine phosphatase n=1 Tax=Herbidospora mongoliensis TaxID=688067 RepID=UPI0008333A62|nr:GAF domain-containing SpoIIE family protein phosphatase [Herbidospora mongoliensis]
MPPELSDAARLAAVRATGLLDTLPDPTFDDLAALAISVTRAPMAFITLVDERRSFWKSVLGLGELTPEQRQNAAEESFCHLVVQDDGPLIITDAPNDERVNDISSVTSMGIGAWAGYPIHSPDGHVLGTLCVVDTVARDWTPGQISALATLARSVTGEIALRDALGRMTRQAATSAALARTLQDSLLPPVLPNPPGADAAAVYVPAGTDTVLGDFYDLFQTAPSRWCAIVGDVSGHGLEAAKLTALARYTVRADAHNHVSACKILDQLNSALMAQRTATMQFLTAACLVFRVRGGDISGVLSTAGHPSALLRRAGGGIEEIRSAGSMLGAFDDPDLRNTHFTLGPGDMLLLYTDGVTEAHRRDDMDLFGDDRLLDTFAACAGLDATGTVDHIRQTVLAFTGGHTVDDIAVFALGVPL